MHLNHSLSAESIVQPRPTSQFTAYQAHNAIEDVNSYSFTTFITPQQI